MEKVRGKYVDFSENLNYIEKNTWKQRGFFDNRNYVEKSTWKQCGFFDQQNYFQNVRENNVEFRPAKFCRKIYGETTRIF